MMKTPIWKCLGIHLLALVMTTNISHASNEGRGGGDQFVADFLKIVRQEIYPLALKNPQHFRASAEEILLAADPTRLVSAPRVFESCDGSNQGREVQMCYDPSHDTIHLSRSLYPIDVRDSVSKRATILHELYRRLKIEGDQYEWTQLTDLSGAARAANPIAPSLEIINDGGRYSGLHGLVKIDSGEGRILKIRNVRQVQVAILTTGSYIQDVGVALYRQLKRPDGNLRVGWHFIDASVLEFKNGQANGQPLSIDPEYNYIITMKGAVHGLPPIALDPVNRPFSLRVALLDRDGQPLLDSQRLPLRREVNRNKSKDGVTYTEGSQFVDLRYALFTGRIGFSL